MLLLQSFGVHGGMALRGRQWPIELVHCGRLLEALRGLQAIALWCSQSQQVYMPSRHHCNKNLPLRRLVNEIVSSSSSIPGLAYKDGIAYIQLNDPDIVNLASNHSQRQFYQVNVQLNIFFFFFFEIIS